ncbi:hypothetical protein CLIB1444_07S06546 [[Candida] jaroonii]|uniref:Uncharacterized protein n=1 Tax=[Candida] jaroonii TaxID=467808 RepID=A0ACA9YAA4_9ASCO|nr:hypothetical protein CLIB1444_07S06546 [[Candida] jaroonii]
MREGSLSSIEDFNDLTPEEFNEPKEFHGGDEDEPEMSEGHSYSDEPNNNLKPNVYFESDLVEEEGEKVVPKPSVFRNIWSSFRPDYITKHLDYESFKVIFRSWIQIWGSVFIMVIPKSMTWMGSGTYLLQIFGFIAPSGGGSIIANVFISVVASLGVSFGWVIVVIVQIITNRIRGSPTIEMIGSELISEGICTPENIEACLTQEMFSGRYLRTDCSVITAIGLFVGVVMLGFLQKINPLFKVVYILSIINISINLCYNVFIPTFSPLLITWPVVKTIYFALTIRIVAALVIFPETSNYGYFKGTIGVLKALKETNTNNYRFFQSMKPSELSFENYKNFKGEIVKIRASMIPSELNVFLSKGEVSYGRLGLGSMGEIRSTLKNLINVVSSFEYLYQLIDAKQNLSRGKTAIDRHRSIVSQLSEGAPVDGGRFKLFGSIHEVYKPVGEFEHQQRLNLIKERFHQTHSIINLKDLDHICDLLKPYFSPYFESSIETIGIITEWLEAANEYRFYTILDPKKHAETQKKLSEKIKACKEKQEANLCNIKNTEALEKYFSKKSKDEETMLSLISTASFVTFFLATQTESELKLLDTLVTIDEQCPKPSFLTFFNTSPFDRSENIYHAMDNEEPNENIPSFSSKIQNRNPDAMAPSNYFHIIGAKVLKVYNAFYDDLLWFWIRSGCLTVITAVPFFCKTTAHWYFENRLVWIVIMCAVSTAQYTGETIYTFGAKMVYSFFGCVVGMVAWYISTGNGHGNSYGFTVVTAFLFLYLIFYRHFSKHQTLVPQILYPVTATLVLGTSWVDGNLSTNLVDVGEGFKPAYLRFISVIIGLCVGFLASVIPRPKSSKVAIRKILSHIIDEIGDIHCSVSSFALRRINSPNFHITTRHDPIIEKLRALLLKMASTAALTIPIDHEISITGNWPNEKYKNLQANITDIIQLYTILLIMLDKIEDTRGWIGHIINRSGWYDVDMNADLLALIHMCSRSLRWKSALPKITQATLSLKHFDLLREQWGINKFSLNERFYNSNSIVRDMEEELERKSVSTNKSLHQSMVENLDYDKLFGHDGNISIVALLVCHMIYMKIDQVVIIVKSLVGEKYDLDNELFTWRNNDEFKQDYKLE